MTSSSTNSYCPNDSHVKWKEFIGKWAPVAPPETALATAQTNTPSLHVRINQIDKETGINFKATVVALNPAQKVSKASLCITLDPKEGFDKISAPDLPKALLRLVQKTAVIYQQSFNTKFLETNQRTYPRAMPFYVFGNPRLSLQDMIAAMDRFYRLAARCTLNESIDPAFDIVVDGYLEPLRIRAAALAQPNSQTQTPPPAKKPADEPESTNKTADSPLAWLTDLFVSVGNWFISLWSWLF